MSRFRSHGVARSKFLLTAIAAVLANVAPAVAVEPTAGVAEGTAPVTQPLTFTGRRSLVDLAAGTVGHTPSAPAGGPRVLPGLRRERSLHAAETGFAAASAPDSPTTPVESAGPGFSGLPGLRAADSLFANANEVDAEPPDHALCVGAGRVVQAVNLAITVYSDGDPRSQFVPAIPLSAFFAEPPEVSGSGADRRFGTLLSDPVCLFDQDVQRFFLVVTGFGLDSQTGEPTGRSHLYLAASATADPVGDWATFTIDTGGDPADAVCPCVDDFPHIGADATGLFMSVNRFDLSGDAFAGAKVHAVSKRALAGAAGATAPVPPLVVTISPGPAGGQPAFDLQPAITPPGAPFAPDLEYLLSTPNALTSSGDRIVLWALSNTGALDSPRPSLRLSKAVIPSLVHVGPPPIVQKPGPIPLGALVGEAPGLLDSGHDAFSESPVFAAGRLWAAMGTEVQGGPGKAPRAGVLWLSVEPSSRSGQVSGRIPSQGYLAVDGDSLIYPSVAVNARGRGAMVMTVAGPGRYPSAAYVEMGPSGPVGPVRIAAPGAAPEDGYSCYAAFVLTAGPCRMGDYSAARVDEHGDVWMGVEYIPPLARAVGENWGTFVGHLQP
jgi:hypothetical protein